MPWGATMWFCLLCLSAWPLKMVHSRAFYAGGHSQAFSQPESNRPAGAFAIDTKHGAGRLLQPQPGASSGLQHWQLQQGSARQRLIQQAPAGASNGTGTPSKSGSVVAWGDLSRLGPTPPEVLSGKVIKIAAGWFLAVALLDSNEVVVWTQRKDPEFKVPQSIQGHVVGIAAGTVHALALLSNGTVVAWGYNLNNQLNVPSALRPNNGTLTAVKVAAGWQHSLVVLSNGSAMAWGLNDNGQCDVPLVAQANVTSLAANWDTSCALLVNGSVVCWGFVATPPTKLGVIAIAEGTDQRVAVERNGSVVVESIYATQDTYYPGILQQVLAVPAAAKDHFVAVAAADNVSMALRDTGEVVAWGWTPAGIQPFSPVPSAAQSKAFAVSAGAGYALALVEGILQAPAPPPPPPPHPTYPPAPPPFTSAHPGATGFVTIWGQTKRLGTQPQNATSGVVKIAAGYTFAMVLLNTSQIVAWSAFNQYGEKNVSDSIQGHVADIAAGSNHGIALLNDGSVAAWGSNGYNQSSVPIELQSGGTAKAISIAAGYRHSLALLANGSVVAWGYDGWGQADVPAAALSNVVSISAGGTTSLAVLSDGTLVQWGVTSSPPQEVYQQGVIAAAAGTDQLVALLRNGTVVSWSSAASKQTYPDFPDVLNTVLAVPDLARSNAVAIAANENVTMALLKSGRVVTWGWTPPEFPIIQVPSAALSIVVAISTGGGYAMALTANTGDTVLSATTSNDGAKLGTGAIVGIVIGAVALVAVVATGILLLVRSRQPRQDAVAKGFDVQPSMPSSQALKGTAMWDQLTKVLRPKETFMRCVAHEYSWIIGSEQTGAMQSVEADVNDTQLDTMYKGNSSPVVELSRAELREQVQLMADGLLGRGATALVFKCLWPSRFGPNSVLAIKVLKDGSDADVGAIQSFAYEAKLLASLQHPNVVRVYGYCLGPPTVCLILEVLPVSLKQRLYGTSTSVKTGMAHTMASSTAATDTNTATSTAATSTQLTIPYTSAQHATTNADSGLSASPNGTAPLLPAADADALVDVHPQASEPSHVPPMSLLEIVRTSTDIAAGLAYLHSQEEPAVIPESEEAGHLMMQPSSVSGKDKRIVHRDLKPANILLNSQGAAKITDFGLARDHDHTTIGTMNMGAGTMPYMAPEQLTAARAGRAGVSATNRVDVYSLGMMMWEMLAGESPWKGKSEDMIFAVVMNHRRPPLPGQPTQEAGSDLVAIQEPLQRDAPGLYDHPLLPELTGIIQQCWQQRDRRRPTAAAVHDMLMQLCSKLEAESTESV